MYFIHHSDPKLNNWNTEVTLSCKEDVATILDVYEKCLKDFKPENIAGFVELDGYYACVVNTSEVCPFDLFAWVNSLYTSKDGVIINCANARFLYPLSDSRGEYIEKVAPVPVSNTDDLVDDSDEVATGFWDEDEIEKTHFVRHVALGEDIPIEDEDGVTFGRSTSRSGYSVENDLMSRLHARVYLEDGRYMVEDLGSKNGTFINNVKVMPGKDREIKPGNLLRMANEEFKFV